MQGILPLLGGLILFFALGWSLQGRLGVQRRDARSYTSWHMPFAPHWIIGGVFLLGIGTFVLGIILMADLAGRGAGVLPRRDAATADTLRPWCPTSTDNWIRRSSIADTILISVV